MLVFESYKGKENKQAVVNALSELFPKEKIYGCSSYGPLTTQGFAKEDAVGVLAIGGEGVKVVAVKADNASSDYRKAGSSLARALGKPEPKESLLLLFGNCHVPSNDKVVKGVQEVLGKTFPVVGGSARGADPLSYFRGEVYPNSVIRILITAPMKISLIRARSKVTEEEVLGSALDAMEEVLDELEGSPNLVFAFECGGRQGALKDVTKEHRILAKALPKGTALFGFYGSGEIGPTATGAPSEGVGFHIVIGAIAVK